METLQAEFLKGNCFKGISEISYTIGFRQIQKVVLRIHMYDINGID